MSEAARRLATYEDLMALGDVRAEVLAGDIHVSPAPLPKHSKAQGSLRRFIGGPYDDDDGYGGPGGWWIFVEVDVELGPHDVVRPDLAGSASGLGGFLQIGGGALLAIAAGNLISVENNAIPLYLIMLLSSVLGTIVSLWMYRHVMRSH